MWESISVGLALIDAIDVMVEEGRMEPQIAIRMVAAFDRIITEVLAEKVKARLTFKVELLGLNGWLK